MQYNQGLSLCLLCGLLLLIKVDVEAKSNAPVDFASSVSLARPSASAAFPSCCWLLCNRASCEAHITMHNIQRAIHEFRYKGFPWA